MLPARVKRRRTRLKLNFLDLNQRWFSRGCDETLRCRRSEPTACFRSDPLLTQSRRVQAKSRCSRGPATLLFLERKDQDLQSMESSHRMASPQFVGVLPIFTLDPAREAN